MKTTMGDRMKLFQEYKKLSPTEFGRTVGAPISTVNFWFNNQSLTVKWLTKIAEVYPELNIYWLLLGTGKMLNETATANVANEPAAGYATDADLQRRIKLLEALLYDELGKKQKGG